MNQLWWILAVAVVAFVAVILILVWFNKSGGSAFDQISKKIGGLNDEDGDGVADMFDDCSNGVDTQKDADVESNGCTKEQNVARKSGLIFNSVKMG